MQRGSIEHEQIIYVSSNRRMKQLLLLVVVVDLFIYSRKLNRLISPLQERQLKILRREIYTSTKKLAKESERKRK